MQEQNWSIADSIARELVQKGADPNELAKVSTYLNHNRNSNDFFTLLDWLNNRGERLARSRQTARYYADIRQACQRLKTIQDVDEMAQTLAWAVRLMRYYPRATLGAEMATEAPEQPRRERPATAPAQETGQVSRVSRVEDLRPGMILEGRVTGIQPFGAFVDISLGRNQGLVHVSELSDRRVADVASVVSVGQQVRVKVLKVETQRGQVRIGLSMKGVTQI